jgi:chromatin remodeling complex protein RSC6
MAEEKGLNKPVKLKADLAAFLGAKSLPRTEITKKLWDYIKAKQSMANQKMPARISLLMQS